MTRKKKFRYMSIGAGNGREGGGGPLLSNNLSLREKFLQSKSAVWLRGFRESCLVLSLFSFLLPPPFLFSLLFSFPHSFSYTFFFFIA